MKYFFNTCNEVRFLVNIYFFTSFNTLICYILVIFCLVFLKAVSGLEYIYMEVLILKNKVVLPRYFTRLSVLFLLKPLRIYILFQ